MKHTWKDTHIVHTVKTLIKVLYATFAFFAIMFVTLHLVGAYVADRATQKEKIAFTNGLKQDIVYLKDQGDAVAKNPEIIRGVLLEDREALIALTKSEIKKRAIGLIGIASAEGVILSRTLSTTAYGDNVFLTTAVGSRIAQGLSTESIEMTRFADEIFMTTGRPIYNDDRLIGGLFSNRLLDSKYTTDMKARYLKPSTEVIFYSKQYGVYSTSFQDPKKQEVVKSYFNSGSDWVQLGTSGKIVYFDDGSSYVIENIVFPGLQSSPGGALIFIPRKDTEATASGIAAFATLFFFLCLAIKHHKNKKKEDVGWRYMVVIVVFSIPIFFIVFFSLRLQNTGRLHLSTIPYTLYNSTLHIQPEWGIYNFGSDQSLSILVDTGDEAINAAEITLTYDPSAVDVKAVTTENSDCSYFIENEIDQQNGKVHISCVVLKKEGAPRSLQIASLTVLPLRIGTYNISFDESTTKILANDGLGTDVLRMSSGGSYHVDNFDLKSLTSDTSKRSFVVFSPTHPNQNHWYNAQNVSFVWIGKPGSVYKYSFDTNPLAVPGNDNTVLDSKVTLPVPGDGIYYFHLQLASGGHITHYKVQSDKTPPTIVSMNVSQDAVRAGDVARFTFEASDKGSGMQKNNYIDLGNHLFLPIGSQLFIPFLYKGTQPVTLRVYDNAGNFSEKTLYIKVLSKI